MTVTEFQALLHKLYQGDTDVPVSTDGNWTVRLGVLEMSVRTWDSEDGVLWRELWKQLSDAADGVKTTTTATSYNGPADMRHPLGGYVRLTDANGQHTFIKVVAPQEAEIHRNENISLCWFTGNYTGSVGGFKLNFLVAPTAGLTINYPYYKHPLIPSAASDVIEMSNPMFAIQMSLSKLHELDGEGDRATLALSLANTQLRSMRINNSEPAWYQDNYVPDRDEGSGGFGN